MESKPLAQATWRTRKYTGPERRQTRRWRSRPLRVLLACLILILVGYAMVVLWLISQETQLVFAAGRTLAVGRPAFPYEQIDLPRADGARQFAWVMQGGDPQDAAPWVLYLHGNASTIAAHVNISHYRQLRVLGLNVLAPEYRGFGGLEGVPTESALLADARVAYDYLRIIRRVPARRIVIYGWSLGSAVAVNLASQVESAAVILEGAPASLVTLGQQRYPFFPIRLMMRNPFESIAKINLIRSPILFLHSPEDAVIPIGEARRLYNAARASKRFVEVRGGHVRSSEVDAEHFFSSIAHFLREQAVLSTPPPSRAHEAKRQKPAA